MPVQNKRKNANARRAPIVRRHKVMALQILLRNKPALRTLSNSLTVEHFDESEFGLAVLWSVLVDYLREYGEMPEEEIVTADVERRLGESGVPLTPEAIEEVDTIISKAFYADDPSGYCTPTLTNWVLSTVREWMQDKLFESAATTFQPGTDTPIDLSEVMTVFNEKAAHIGALTMSEDLGVPFPSGWKPTSIGKRSTSVSWLDAMMEGGHAPGEVNLFAAPYGTCKTLLGIQMSIGCARLEYNRWRNAGCKGTLGLAIFANYEDLPLDCRLRALSCLGAINKKHLEDYENGKLSRRGNLYDYEKEMFKAAIAAGKNPPGEYERLIVARNALNLNWRYLPLGDTTDPTSRRLSGMGHRGLLEFCQMLVDRPGPNGERYHIDCLVIDYALTMIEKELIASGENMKELRNRLDFLPEQLRADIGLPFNVPIMLMQQLSTAANAGLPGRATKFTDTAESHGIARRASFAITVGTKTVDNLVVASVSKGRRGDLSQPTILQIRGKYSRIDEASKNYVYDARTSRIVTRDMHDLVGIPGVTREEGDQPIKAQLTIPGVTGSRKRSRSVTGTDKSDRSAIG